jgi:fluoride exporter
VSPGIVLAVAGGGFVGAPARYLTDRAISTRVASDRPWGTVAINVSGSFILGLLAGLAGGPGLTPTVQALFGTGFCGAFTTFSAFSFESITLAEDGRLVEAAGNVALSVVMGLSAAALGIWLGLTA